jgi:hypothetical protein
VSDSYPVSLVHIQSIIDILGSTKPNLWPFSERLGITVAGITAGADLIPSETSAAAEALEDDFNPMLHPGGLYTYHFQPSGDHHLSGGDHGDYSFGNGTADSAMSVGALIIPSLINDNTIMAKYDSAGGKEEYRFFIDSSAKVSLELHDASASTKEVMASDTALVVGRPRFVVVTYDGAQATPAVTPYVDGESDGDGSTTETGAYVAMENTSAPLTIGCAGVSATPTTEFHGRIGLPFLAGKLLTAADVRALWNIYRVIFGLP